MIVTAAGPDVKGGEDVSLALDIWPLIFAFLRVSTFIFEAPKRINFSICYTNSASENTALFYRLYFAQHDATGRLIESQRYLCDLTKVNAAKIFGI